MFCGVIEFQSSHWKTPRTLNLVEFVYLMAQIITTVGYGDITPASDKGRTCMGLFLVAGLLIWVDVLSHVASAVVEQYKDLGDKLRLQALQHTWRRAHEWHVDHVDKDQAEAEEDRLTKSLSHVIEDTGVEKQLARALFAYVAIGVIGAVFFHMSEKKSPVVSVYMVVMASSSLGFGACTPVTRHGFAFSAFWMMLACFALGVLIGNISELAVVLERHHKSHLAKGREAFVAACEGVRKKDGDSVNLYEFSRLMLLYTDTVTLSDLQCLEDIFQELKKAEQAEYVKIKAVERACYTKSFDGSQKYLRRYPTLS